MNGVFTTMLWISTEYNLENRIKTNKNKLKEIEMVLNIIIKHSPNQEKLNTVITGSISTIEYGFCPAVFTVVSYNENHGKLSHGTIFEMIYGFYQELKSKLADDVEYFTICKSVKMLKNLRGFYAGK